MFVYLLINGLLYLLVGFWCAYKPTDTARSVGFELTGPQGLAEFTAVYGGLEIGLGAFFLLSALSDSHRPMGLLAALCIYGGLVCLRSYSLIVNGSDIQNGWLFMGLEASLLVWAIWLYARS